MYRFIKEKKMKFLKTFLKGNSMKFLLLGIFNLIIIYNASSQCNDSLRNIAIKNSGNDALFIREFYIQNFKRRPLKIGTFERYEVRMNKGFIYRFNLENDTNYQAEAVLQLYDGKILLASTLNTENKIDFKQFEYICDKTKTYEAILFFKQNNKGCAAGVMSVVVKDTSNLNLIKHLTNPQNILYTHIDNYIDIAVSDIPKGSIDVNISHGTIKRKNGLYIVNLTKEGFVDITVTAKDSLGKITETIKNKFIVKHSILPEAAFADMQGGVISKHELLNRANKLELIHNNYSINYKIKEFTVAKNRYSKGVRTKNSEYLSYYQQKLIQDLKDGDTFFIKNIIIIDDNKNEYELDMLGFIVKTDNQEKNKH